MKSRKIERRSWRPVLDAISKEALSKRAEIEVAGLKLGDQVEAEWVPLLGIVHDARNDLIEIALEGVDHLVRTPRELHVVEEPAGVSSVIAVDGDGNRHIIKLRDPLMLPAPADARH